MTLGAGGGTGRYEHCVSTPCAEIFGYHFFIQTRCRVSLNASAPLWTDVKGACR